MAIFFSLVLLLTCMFRTLDVSSNERKSPCTERGQKTPINHTGHTQLCSETQETFIKVSDVEEAFIKGKL